LKSFEDADVGRTEAAAAPRHEADRAAGKKTIQALEISVIFERDMIAHGDVPLT